MTSSVVDAGDFVVSEVLSPPGQIESKASVAARGGEPIRRDVIAPARHAPVGLAVSLAPLPKPGDASAYRTAVAALQAQWDELSPRAACSFFTSWSWIGCWLAGLPDDTDLHLLRATHGARTVGLAVLVRGPWRRVGGVPVAPAWHLHATGRPGLDSLCIEYNGVLADARYAAQAEVAMLAHWFHATRGARELHLPSLPQSGDPALWRQRLAQVGVTVDCEVRERTAYIASLDAVRQAGGDCLALLSSHLRTQLRRTMKVYEQIGPLTLEVAVGAEQALEFLERLIELHQARWRSRGKSGAFSSAHFASFHRRLVRQEIDRGGVQLLRLRVGEQDLGLLYSFVHAGRVSFYQSGLNYDLGGKFARPGYVTNLLAINLNARLGYKAYDFMVGDALYKRSLTDTHEPLSDVVLRTPSLRFGVERVLRQGVRRAKAALRG